VEFLVLWGVGQVGSFLFKPVLEELAKLAKDALDDYVKDFFNSSIGEVFDLAKETALKIAFGQALGEFLRLVQDQLEFWDVDDNDIRHYTASLKIFIGDREVRENLGKPFSKALGKALPDESLAVDTVILMQKWESLGLHSLPDGFNWKRLAKLYRKRVEAIIQGSDNLREILNAENIKRIRESLEQLVPIGPDFNLSRYQEGLKTAYSRLKLDSLTGNGSGSYYKLELWNMFVPQRVQDEDNPQQLLLSIAEILENEATYKYTVILGNPGAGKSTLVQYMALRWARNPVSQLPALELPLVIELRNYIENHKKSLCHNFLEYFNQATGVIGGTLNQQELHQWLTNRPSIVMFDGLDEVLDPRERENVTIDIINFSNSYPQARILVTSRLVGYQQQRQKFRDGKFGHFILQDLEAGQISRFISKWHELTFENKTDGEIKRHRLQRAIDSYPAFREIAGNPLLLTMMAILNRGEELPRDRATLYEKASELLLQRWEAEKYLESDDSLDPKIKKLDYRDKQEILRQVAHKIQENISIVSGDLFIGETDLQNILAEYLKEAGFPEYQILARDLKTQLTTRSFILCFFGGDAYGFVHKTFLEYFCAWYFVWQYEKKRIITLDDIKNQVLGKNWHHPAWHEVLKLMVGMVDDKFSGELLEYLIGLDGKGNNFMNLFLAAACISDVRNRGIIGETDRKLRDKLEELVANQTGVTEEIRQQASNAIANHWDTNP
jgi:predicted NACHT family NTPase